MGCRPVFVADTVDAFKAPIFAGIEDDLAPLCASWTPPNRSADQGEVVLLS